MDNRCNSTFHGSTSSASNNSRSPLLEKIGFQVGKKIGIGAYSTVRVAYSEKRKESVALKIIWKNTASQLFQTHFLPREIDIVKSLRHPNILQYFQCIETDRRFIIVMEYAQHGSLLDLMAKKHVLAETEAWHYFRQLILALDFCHTRKIAHRDLKPENLLIFPEKCLKIGDFGFARHFNVEDSYSLTFCGSNAYISPEILHQQPYNPLLADVWSCGVILFVMIYGDLPFEDTGSIRKLTELIDKGLVLPSDKAVSIECKNTMKRLMAAESCRPNIKSVSQDPWVLSPINGTQQ